MTENCKNLGVIGVIFICTMYSKTDSGIARSVESQPTEKLNVDLLSVPYNRAGRFVKYLFPVILRKRPITLDHLEYYDKILRTH